MSHRLARIVTGLSVLAIVARTVALVARSRVLRASPAPTPAPAPAGAPSVPVHRVQSSVLHPGAESPSERSDHRALVGGSLLGLELAAVIAAGVAPAPVRALLILAAMVALPGGAITLRLRLGDALTALALTVALGLTADVFAGLAMVWTGWWHPVAAAAVLGGASTASILPLVRGRLPVARLAAAPPLSAVLGALPALAAVGLWGLSLGHRVDLVHLANIGLPAGLPLTWYLAVAVALGGAVCAAGLPSSRGVVVGLHVAALALIVFGTLPAFSQVAPYSWTYKHIGVTALIEQTGTVHTSVDIYNRWPGFFAAAAAFARLSAVAPSSFAAWFEPLFVALDALLVAALARAVTGRARVAAWAAVLFTISNFVGQDYFSPQALAYVLGIAVLVLVMRQLTSPDAMVARVRAVVDRLGPRPAATSTNAAAPIAPAASLALVIALQAAIVATHQLTPYVLVAQVGALTLLGATRPRWLVAVLGLMTLAYLLPNLAFIRDHFGLFPGFDPMGNAHVATVDGGQPWAVINGGDAVSKLLSALALVAAIRLVRLGHGRMVTLLGVSALIPYLILFASSYGGEAALRVFLFSAPWRIVLVAWGLATLRGLWRPLLAGAVILAAFAALSLPTFLGRAPLVVIPPGEVAASHYFYSHAPAGSVLTLAGPDFPTRLQPSYARMADPEEDVNLMLYPALRGHRLGAADIQKVVDFMQLYSRSDFLVFAATETRYSVATGLTPAGSLPSLERAVARSSRFRLWYRAPDARIYHLVGS